MLKIAREGEQYMVELFQVNKLNTLFSDLVKEQLRELVEKPGVNVVFNLDGVSFIDSAGFRVLLEITERAGKYGSRFMLCNVSEEISELIILQELESRFTFCSCRNSEEKILLVLD